MRVYFAETHIQYCRQIIKNAWYEFFSESASQLYYAYADIPPIFILPLSGTIGNICGIIAGFSLIGICELLFFLAKQLWHACKAERKVELGHSHAHGRSRARTNGRSKGVQQWQPEREQEQKRLPMELLILP